ncbi:hypothetical protein KIN20_003336 [Parelaphostrongylus tenuis]|uniref:Very-long-chain 3-oxoacyl-CoA synthase n=1 Tax=Parelaphostrongylus tenuis TaxID=148309 RepID=A0AAD5LX55_PARTN|nr:hypothetical protein KIN20_003336 [Parelaphostrongylus tenuis]
MARYDYQPKYGLENYTVILPIEDSFDPVTSTAWMQKNWLHSVSLSVRAYVVLIYAGQKVMEGRKPFGFDVPLFLWNTGLALFSLLGFCSYDAGMAMELEGELVRLLSMYGLVRPRRHRILDRTICDEQSC